MRLTHQCLIAARDPIEMASEQVDEAQLMEQVSSMRSQEVMQEFMQTVRDKCFDKCVTKPSSSLSSSEQQCLARCSDRYTEVTPLLRN